MTRDDLVRFCGLDIDFGAIGLMESGVPQPPYFCTPAGAQYVGRLGCDGVHFILLPEDERVFCVDPAMGDIGSYVLPVGENFRQFLSFILFCRDANPIRQIHWLDEVRFRRLLAEDRAPAAWSGREALLERKNAALSAVTDSFGLEPVDPYCRVKALQADFDGCSLCFSDEYYDILGLDPRDPFSAH